MEQIETKKQLYAKINRKTWYLVLLTVNKLMIKNCNHTTRNVSKTLIKTDGGENMYV